MKNEETKQKAGIGKKILLAAAVILVLLILLLAVRGRSNDTASGQEETPEEARELGLEFPYALENGKLEVSSLFQYSGDNPDCGDEMGEDTAALAVTNLSEQHLTCARFTAELADGTQLRFEVTDIPAGQTVWAFEAENTAYDLENTCLNMSCEASFEDVPPLAEDSLETEVSGTSVTLTNVSGAELTNVTVYCHCWFNEVNFGGLTYAYPVSSIPAGESVEIQAEECYLGEAAVVRVSKDG